MSASKIILDPKISTLPFYITRCATDFIGSTVIREKGFDEYQIMQCIHGKGFFECGGNHYEIGPSDLVIFNPYIPHKYGPSSDCNEPWLLNWICFLSSSNDLLSTHLTPKGYSVLKGLNTFHLTSTFEQVALILSNDSTYHQLQGAQILYTLILEIIALKWNILENNAHKKLLEPVIQYMSAHLTEDLSIDALSSIIQVSPSYLCRQFKKTYQVSPIKYLIKLRMFKAQELICTYPHMTIKEIGYKCGYNDPSYFCAEFKRSFRITPTQYKEEFLSKPYSSI